MVWAEKLGIEQRIDSIFLKIFMNESRWDNIQFVEFVTSD